MRVPHLFHWCSLLALAVIAVCTVGCAEHGSNESVKTAAGPSSEMSTGRPAPASAADRLQASAAASTQVSTSPLC